VTELDLCLTAIAPFMILFLLLKLLVILAVHVPSVFEIVIAAELAATPFIEFTLISDMIN
jgi:hypothetical protein